MKDIWSKDLIYRGYKVVPSDPRIGATLSQHELAQGYRDVKAPSIFIRFALKDEANTAFLVWTTTPWTIPVNRALAYSDKIKYSVIQLDKDTEHFEDKKIVIASELINKVSEECNFKNFKILKEFKGSDFKDSICLHPLKNMGYEVVPQVGVSGFYIDIGIKHKSFPDGFIAGIECDGRTYHSSKSQRDSDLLRQNVLEDLGWNIYRIWSTDWWLDPKKELRKVDRYLQKLI